MMAKKILALFMAVLMALSLTATALADVVWEPRNSFYETHHSQCTYLGRSYYANGPDGFVTLWDAPGGSTVAAQYENGTALSVYWTYKNWGCITVWEGKNREEVSGWVPMEQLYLIYDHISFEEEYGAYFKPYDGQFDGSGLKDGDEIWIWEHPLSYGPKDTLKIGPDWDFLEQLQGSTGSPSAFSQTYTDPNGRIWGYVGYLYGYRSFWVLLENPTCDGIMTSCIPEADGLITSGEIVPPRTPVLPTVSYLPCFLVAGVVAVTAVLLVMMKRRRKSS